MVTNLWIQFKSWLINKLGGYTVGQVVAITNRSKKEAALEIKEKADSIYGTNLQDWCNQVYYYICNMYLSGYCAGDADEEV